MVTRTVTHFYIALLILTAWGRDPRSPWIRPIRIRPTGDANVQAYRSAYHLLNPPSLYIWRANGGAGAGDFRRDTGHGFRSIRGADPVAANCAQAGERGFQDIDRRARWKFCDWAGAARHVHAGDQRHR